MQMLLSYVTYTMLFVLTFLREAGNLENTLNNNNEFFKKFTQLFISC